ncbi:hypothetical protein A2U01_0098236, partial [Trifolium medium]|nr:hypothetical protein [Trifolium medium]
LAPESTIHESRPEVLKERANLVIPEVTCPLAMFTLLEEAALLVLDA